MSCAPTSWVRARSRLQDRKLPAASFAWGDELLAGDDVRTDFVYGSFNWEKVGARLASTITNSAAGTESMAYVPHAYGFDTPASVTQSAGGSSRTWTYDYSATGALIEETDPDGVSAHFTQGACGLLDTRTDAAGFVEDHDHDANCRLIARSYLGATTDTDYDGFGRTTLTETTAAGGDTLGERTFREDDTTAIAADDQPDVVSVSATDTVVESWLDGWGRSVRTVVCEVPGAYATSSTDLDDVRCTSALATDGLATESHTLYAADGSTRATVAPVAIDLALDLPLGGVEAVSSWLWSDEFGRAELVRSPSPTADAAAPAWESVETVYLPAQVIVTGPTRACSVEFTTLESAWSCEGFDRGSEVRDALGRVVTATDPLGVTWETLYDDFGRPEVRRLQGAGVPVVGGVTLAAIAQTWTDGDRLEREENEQGDVTRHVFDAAGRVVETFHKPTGAAERLVSSASFATSVSGGLRTDVAYDLAHSPWFVTRDGLGRVVATLSPDLTATAATYDAAGRVETATDARGGSTQYAYDYLSRLVVAEDDLHAQTTYDYDALGRLALTTDADGVEVATEYTWGGLPIARWQGSALVAQTAYRADGLVQSSTAGAVVTTYAYDDLGRQTEACVGEAVVPCVGDGQGLRWSYDDGDRLLSEGRWSPVTSAWVESSTTFNDLGWATGLEHPDATTESWEYDALGRLREHVDAASVSRTWEYDAWGRLERESIPGLSSDRVHSYSFGSFPSTPPTHEVVEPDGRGSRWRASASPSGPTGQARERVRHSTCRGPLGRADDGDPDPTRFDWLGRTLDYTDAEGVVTAYDYVGGDLNHVVRPGLASEEVHWGFWTDRTGQMLARAGPMEASEWASASGPTPPDPNAGGPYGFLYSYTPAGRLETRVGANEEQTTWGYDDGFVVSEAVGSTAVEDAITRYDYVYDGYGELESELHGGQVSGAARETIWSRDGAGRTTAVTVDDPVLGFLETSYSDFDAYGRGSRWRAHASPSGPTREARERVRHSTCRGPFVRADDGDTLFTERTVGPTVESSRSLETDLLGRVTRVQQAVARVGGGTANIDVVYERGADGQVDRVEWAGKTVVYDRSPVDRRITQVVWQPGTTGLANVTGRDLAGRNTGVSISGGASVARSFDPMGRLITQETTSPAGTVEARSYVYDWRGRVESVGVSIAGFPTEDVEYAYTVEGWLTEEARTSYAGSAPVTTVRAHTYDDAGNRLTTATDGVADHTWTYDEGNLAATMDGLAYGFNPQGEMEEDPRGYSFLRAPDGVEIEIADPASGLAYAIARDPAGNPVGVYDGVTERVQVWGNPELDQPLVVDEVSGATAEMVVGIEGLQIGRKAPSGAFTAAVTDALGSLVLDGNTLVGVPEAFGLGAEPVAGSRQRHVYAGLESLPGTPYQLARARVMDPTVGRFVSADPTGLDGGDHRFIHAESQPTGFVDPGGLTATGAPGAGRQPTMGERIRAAQGMPGTAACVMVGTCVSASTWAPGTMMSDISDVRRIALGGYEADPLHVIARPLASDGGLGAGNGGGTLEGALATLTEGTAGMPAASEPAGSSSGSDGGAGLPGGGGATEVSEALLGQRGAWIAEQVAKSKSETNGSPVATGIVELMNSFDAYKRGFAGAGLGYASDAIWGIEAMSRTSASNPFKYTTSQQLLRAGQYLTDEGYRRDSTWAAVGASHGLAASIGADVVVPGLGREMTAPQRALMSHEAQIATALERGLCFTGDTPVLTHTGWRPIAEVEVGDRVWSCAEGTGEDCGWRRVVQVTEHGGGEVVRLEAVSAFGDAVVVDVTVEHPFFVKGSGWRGAGELQEGDRLVGADGTELWVESLRPFAEGQRVYNLTVAVGHTYFVGGDDHGGQGVWVHNKGGGAGGVPRVFWSETQEAAERLARSLGGETIGQTPAGRALATRGVDWQRGAGKSGPRFPGSLRVVRAARCTSCFPRAVRAPRLFWRR